ncbi:MAG: glycosyltransferase, partial [bacterium]|nr:glycosyltransferase [bacterium]
MKLLVITRALEFNGGIGLYLKETLPILKKAGYDIKLIITSQISYDILQFFLPLNISVSVIPEIDFRNQEEPPDTLIKLVKEFNPEAAILHNFISINATIFLKKNMRVFYFYHTLNRLCPTGIGLLRVGCSSRHTLVPGLKCRINTLLNNCWDSKQGRRNLKAISPIKMSFYLQLADGHIVTSEFMKEQLIKNRIQSGTIHKIPLFPVNSPENINQYVYPPKRNKILYLGRITREKGAHLIPKILSMVKSDFEAEIIGTGYYFENLKKDIKKYNLENKIKLMGWLEDREQIYKSISESTITIIPSLWHEPFGLVGIESMQLKTPVIGFNIGGIPEYVRDGEAGFLIKYGNIKQFAEKIDSLLKNKQEAMKMGESASEFIEKRFTKEKHLKELKNIIKIEKNKVTAVIINFNGKRFLEKAIESIRDQTYKNIEIMVVDNKSIDGSVEYLQKLNGIEVKVMDDNLGIGPAVNKILPEISSEYLF